VKPKDRAIAALEMQQPDKVPTMEIDFQLHETLLGKKLILGKTLGNMQGKEKEKALYNNAEIYVETAEKLDYSSITVHPPAIECSPGYIPPWSYPNIEDELKVIKMVNEMAEDRILVAMGIDGTYAIPEGDGYLDFIYSLTDSPEEKEEEAQKRVSWAIEIMKKMIDAGASIMYNCSDYCFNNGPFLSPEKFEQFIYPYLKRQTEALKAEGAYVIKHTDGNIMPIIDMIIDTGPHAIQSIDPVAKVDIKEVKKKYGKRICLMGNVDTTKLQMGTKEEILKSAEYSIKNGMQGGGYIYSSCNSIFDGVPLENYLVMLKARDLFGTY
jgi:Uroporphyrinogen-III decarboxylase